MARFMLIGLAAALLGLLAGDLSAQVPIDPQAVLAPGTYDITNVDGSPIRPGKEVGTDIVQFGTATIGFVWIQDTGNEDSRVYVPGETFVVTPYLPGAYAGTNDRGNTFEVNYNLQTGQWISEMTSGPNDGTRRAWTPRND